jgi:hypothetical protein
MNLPLVTAVRAVTTVGLRPPSHDMDLHSTAQHDTAQCVMVTSAAGMGTQQAGEIWLVWSLVVLGGECPTHAGCL